MTPGRWADLTVFDQDLSRLPPEQWAGVEVAMTIVNGRSSIKRHDSLHPKTRHFPSPSRDGVVMGGKAVIPAKAGIQVFEFVVVSNFMGCPPPRA